MNIALRTPLVLPLAAGVTVGLFLMMRALIDIGPVTFEEAAPDLQIEMNLEVPDTEARGSREMPEPEPIDPPPAVRPSPVDPAVPDQTASMENYDVPAIEPPRVTNTTGPIRLDGNPTPVVRINPVYPDNLAMRGIDGQCDMIFDILPNGTTTNVRVLSCSNRGFERASIRAIERWRYNPQVRNGAPTTYQGARTQLLYSMEG